MQLEFYILISHNTSGWVITNKSSGDLESVAVNIRYSLCAWLCYKCFSIFIPTLCNTCCYISFNRSDVRDITVKFGVTFLPLPSQTALHFAQGRLLRETIESSKPKQSTSHSYQGCGSVGSPRLPCWACFSITHGESLASTDWLRVQWEPLLGRQF